MPALALIVRFIDFQFMSPYRFQGALQIKALASAATPKVVLYWDPYWMALLAGFFFARAARRAGARARPDRGAGPHGVPNPPRARTPRLRPHQALGRRDLGLPPDHAARGYWAGKGDRRWVLDDNYQAVADALTAEHAAGKIDYYTHVMVISRDVESVELALATGISADVVSPKFDPNGYWNLDSPVRQLTQINQAFAEHPPT